MTLLEQLPLNYIVFVFTAAAILIGIFGVKMTHVARTLAADTGIGVALMGAVFIGASTSLSGIIASVTAASSGHAELAVSNALGGIAAQTAFLAIADMFYRKANLEHAAASAVNLMMSAFLITLLALHLLAFTFPHIHIASVHPVSVILIIAYLFGLRLLARTHQMPMWLPRHTRETLIEKDKSTIGRNRQKHRNWIYFFIYTFIVGLSGWILSRAGIVIATTTGLSEGLVGGIFTAVTTSLPELVIAITAVRLGSLTLAVGDIIGGNAFDTLFIAVSDLAYLQGPIYAGISTVEQFWLAITMLMTGIILMGLLYRQRYGIANIGWESLLIFLLYIGSLFYVAW